MKNITLSADEKAIAMARAYARAHGTTLNQLIRDYIQRLTGLKDIDGAAGEFASLAQEKAGESSEGFHFDRQSVHARGENE